MIEILNTIICYNNSKEIEGYLESCQSLNDSDKVAFVVTINKLDNVDIKSFIERITSLSENIYVINPHDNLGYLNGMIEGYKYFINEAKIKPAYVIMSNTDIYFPDKCFFSKLLNKTYKQNILCIGPSVYVEKNKNYDNPVSDKRYKKSDLEFFKSVMNIPFLNSLYWRLSNFKRKFIKKTIGDSREVYSVHGCFFILKSIFADYLVDHPFGRLLYGEEAYISESIYSLGCMEYFDKELVVVHREHSVTGKIKYSSICKMSADSTKYILENFYYEKKL